MMRIFFFAMSRLLRFGLMDRVYDPPGPRARIKETKIPGTHDDNGVFP